MNAWGLYWLLKLDALQGFCVGMVFFCGVTAALLVVCGVVAIEEGDINPGNRLLKSAFVPLLGVVFFVVARTLTPSTKEMCAIIVVPKVTNAIAESEALTKMPAKMLKLADDWVEELSPKKAENE